jgi:hypothetical protein
LTTACTLLPLIPTQAPTGSIEESWECTQIFALLPGSLATDLISIVPSYISGLQKVCSFRTLSLKNELILPSIIFSRNYC